MGDSVSRIEGYMPGYQGGGGGAVFVAPKNNRAQRFHNLFVAIDAADMAGADHALTALLNFDPQLAQDGDFVKITRAVHDRQVYAAQHFSHEYQLKLAHQLEVLTSHKNLASSSPPAKPLSTHRDDGLPHVDTLA